jgi:hypothetical protein
MRKHVISVGESSLSSVLVNKLTIRSSTVQKYYTQMILINSGRKVGGRFQWPSGLRRGSEVDRLLGLRVRIPPGVWMFVCCECCVVR